MEITCGDEVRKPRFFLLIFFLTVTLEPSSAFFKTLRIPLDFTEVLYENLIERSQQRFTIMFEKTKQIIAKIMDNPTNILPTLFNSQSLLNKSKKNKIIAVNICYPNPTSRAIITTKPAINPRVA